MLGRAFEEEICSQPALWARIAASGKAYDLARAVSDLDVVLLGSGSSLFVSQLGALALRRRGIRASALAASEAPFDNGAYKNCAVIALSQSGQSADLLAALDVLKPSRLVALTNSANSPLAQRADIVIDVEAGPEIAVPASKSVTAMAAVLLWTAAIAAGTSARNADTLNRTAEDVNDWLSGDAPAELSEAARRIVSRRSIIVVGTGYGLPIASEIALKFKEVSYLHAEGFAAGEFRHGSTALLDPACAIIGIVDDASRAAVNRAISDAVQTESLQYVIGGHIGQIPLLGPIVGEAFNTLAWLITGQMLTLMTGRARYVESDAPRGLTKVML